MKGLIKNYRAYSKKNFLLFAAGFFSVTLTVFGFLYEYTLNVMPPKSIELIRNWHLKGAKSVSTISNPNIPYPLKDKNTLQITYDLHGLCLLGNNASAMAIEQGAKRYSISLSQYGKNCYSGEQIIDIPLRHFKGFDTKTRIDKVTATFWYPTQYSITIKSAVAYKAERNVLGDSVRPDYTKYHKTFPNITPIRPFPYATHP